MRCSQESVAVFRQSLAMFFARSDLGPRPSRSQHHRYREEEDDDDDECTEAPSPQLQTRRSKAPVRKGQSHLWAGTGSSYIHRVAEEATRRRVTGARRFGFFFSRDFFLEFFLFLHDSTLYPNCVDINKTKQHTQNLLKPNDR